MYSHVWFGFYWIRWCYAVVPTLVLPNHPTQATLLLTSKSYYTNNIFKFNFNWLFNWCRYIARRRPAIRIRLQVGSARPAYVPLLFVHTCSRRGLVSFSTRISVQSIVRFYFMQLFEAKCERATICNRTLRALRVQVHYRVDSTSRMQPLRSQCRTLHLVPSTRGRQRWAMNAVRLDAAPSRDASASGSRINMERARVCPWQYGCWTRSSSSRTTTTLWCAHCPMPTCGSATMCLQCYIVVVSCEPTSLLTTALLVQCSQRLSTAVICGAVQVDQLLSLQKQMGLDKYNPIHDEQLLIVMHQSRHRLRFTWLPAAREAVNGGLSPLFLFLTVSDTLFWALITNGALMCAAYELWLKQVLLEIDSVCALFLSLVCASRSLHIRDSDYSYIYWVGH